MRWRCRKTKKLKDISRIRLEEYEIEKLKNDSEKARG